MPNHPKAQHLIFGRTSGNINLPVLVDSSGAVQIGGAGSGGTSSSYGSAFPSAGTAAGFKDSSGVNMAPGNLDSGGNLKVAVISGGGAGVSPATATNSTKSFSTSVQTALASNGSRIGAEFMNDADGPCFLKYGTAATTSDFIRKLLPGEHFNLPRAAYTGTITCIWDTTGSAGTLRITELSA